MFSVLLVVDGLCIIEFWIGDLSHFCKMKISCWCEIGKILDKSLRIMPFFYAGSAELCPFGEIILSFLMGMPLVRG